MSYLEYIKKKEYHTPTISFEEVEEGCDILAGSPRTDGERGPIIPGGGDEDAFSPSKISNSWSEEGSYFEDEWE